MSAARYKRIRAYYSTISSGAPRTNAMILKAARHARRGPNRLATGGGTFELVAAICFGGASDLRRLECGNSWGLGLRGRRWQRRPR
jgi:hypothetical protein